MYRISARLFLVFTLMLAYTELIQARSLDATEEKIITWSDSHTGEAISLIEKLVNINSGTFNTAGITEVAGILQAELTGLDFKTRLIQQPASMGRGPHLFAEHKGGQGKKLLLIGHLDTVFEADDPFQHYEAKGSIATGPGVEDMKSGDVIIIYALKALQAAGVLANTQIRVAYSGDEEESGKPVSVSRKDMIAAGKWADVALGFESGVEYDGKEWATIARRSSSAWCLEVSGIQAHSSKIFNSEVGAGAIFEAARILDGFYQSVRGEQYLTFNAGTIMGGTEVDGDCEAASGTVFGKTNVIPNRVIVRGGMRTISQAQTERTRKAMQAVVAKHLPKTSATISFIDSYPAMAPTAGNKALASMLSDINITLGGEAMPLLDPLKRGAADISFVAPYTDGLAGMGAYGEGGHTPQEHLDLDSISMAIQRAAILIYRLSR